MTYDSTSDSLKHIRRVNHLLLDFARELLHRAQVHDESKLHEPEKSGFDTATPKLAGLTYGSDEYKAAIKELGIALDHHYANNTHHPEHYGVDGINGFDLLDLVEMFFDWKAATERHNDGNLLKSIEHNLGRFQLGTQIANIFKNTAVRMKLLPENRNSQAEEKVKSGD